MCSNHFFSPEFSREKFENALEISEKTQGIQFLRNVATMKDMPRLIIFYKKVVPYQIILQSLSSKLLSASCRKLLKLSENVPEGTSTDLIQFTLLLNVAVSDSDGISANQLLILTRRFPEMTKMPLLPIRKLPEVSKWTSWLLLYDSWRHLKSFSGGFLVRVCLLRRLSDTWRNVCYLTEQ